MFIFLLAIGIIGGGMAASLLGIFLVRRLVSLHFLEEHTPVASAFIQIVGTLYAVLIAFSVVTTWDHYQKARDVADREANCLNDIFRFSQGLTVAERDPLQLALIAYGKTVVEDEWDRMASGQESQRSMDAYQRIWDLESQMSPTTDRDRALYAKSLDRLQDMSDARRQRMIYSRGGLGAIMWFTLIAGGIAHHRVQLLLHRPPGPQADAHDGHPRRHRLPEPVHHRRHQPSLQGRGAHHARRHALRRGPHGRDPLPPVRANGRAPKPLDSGGQGPMAKQEEPNKVIYSMVGVGKVHGPKQVLKDIYLGYFYGAKIGVIGANGSGKTTLLRIMAGEETEFLGEVHKTAGYTVGHLEQEPKLDPEKTVLDVVKEGVAETVALLKRYDEINEAFADPDADYDKLIEEQGKVQDQLEAAGAWDLDARLELAMDALRCPARRHPRRRSSPAASCAAWPSAASS